jgi:hypothetical protein
MLVVDLAAARAINSIVTGASIVADCPVSRSEKRATSLSNRFFISSSDDLCSRGVLIIPIYLANADDEQCRITSENLCNAEANIKHENSKMARP